MTNLLFICKFNRFRSRLAEAYFNQINKNPKLHAKSGGIFAGKYPLDPNQVKLSKSLGVNLKGKPHGINIALLGWADTYVIVADDVPPSLIPAQKYHRKLIVWRIKDSHHDNDKQIIRTANQIKKKIEWLIKKLK